MNTKQVVDSIALQRASGQFVVDPHNNKIFVTYGEGYYALDGTTKKEIAHVNLNGRADLIEYDQLNNE